MLATCSESSKQQNDQRLQLLAAKQRLISSVLEAAKADLKKKAKGSGYGDMVATLLCQVRALLCLDLGPLCPQLQTARQPLCLIALPTQRRSNIAPGHCTGLTRLRGAACFASRAWQGPSRQRPALQAMAKLQEPSQVVQCREEDVKTVDAALSKAQSKYKSKYGTEAPQLTLDRTHFLAKGAGTQAQEDDPDHESWCAARQRGAAALWLAWLLASLSEHPLARPLTLPSCTSVSSLPKPCYGRGKALCTLCCGVVNTAQSHAAAACSLGGVVVVSPDGRIVVNNTLDARLKIVEEEQLPAIRGQLFD